MNLTHIIMLMKRTLIALNSLWMWTARLSTLCFLGFYLLITPARAEWAKMSPSVPSAETIVDLASCQNTPNCFYAATAHQIFRFENNQWQKTTLTLPPDESIVRMRTFSRTSHLWIQTRESIFCLDPSSGKATKVYSATDPEKYPLSFSAGSKNIWIGTSSGIWASQNSGKSWSKRSDLADHLSVSLLFESSIGLFFSANGEWRVSEEASPQTLIKNFSFTDQPEEDSAVSSHPEEDARPYEAQAFFDFIETEENFYLASAKGVFQSRNGFDWQLLPGSGLRAQPLSRLGWDQKNKRLFGISSEGFFVFDTEKQSWISQNNGLAKTDMRAALLIFPNVQPVAANSEGLWAWKETSLVNHVAPENAVLFNELIRLEPSARDIHKQVIRYSDTGNEKIKRWHAESRLASLLPAFSLGKDWGTSNNIDLDRAGTGDPDRFIHGPWNKDRGADLDLSWSLGDFIFSSNQTSIDSRAKLNVDLRNDLLAEATRLYYERRRLQAETLRDPAPDEQAHLDRLLRIDELTSLLDALTNGFLSNKLEFIYNAHPELEEIWKYKKLKT